MENVFHLLYAGGCVPFAVLKLSDGKVKNEGIYHYSV